MKKLKYIILFFITAFIFTGCNSDSSSLSLKEDEIFCMYLQKQIREPIEFIEITDSDLEGEERYKEYKFLIKDRNIEFIAKQSIINKGLYWFYEPEPLWDDFRYEVNYSDYFNVIRKNNHDNFVELAKKYNLNFNEEYEYIVISNLDNDSIDNAYMFLKEAEKTCDFKAINNNYHEEFDLHVESKELDTSLKNTFKRFSGGDYNIISFKKNYSKFEFRKAVKKTCMRSIKLIEEDKRRY